MWKKAFDKNELRLHVELSTQCNAACPQCTRFKDEKGTLNEWVSDTQWSFEDFKNMFPVETLSHLANIHFSGLFGDPCMCRDMIPIVQYIMDNSNSNVTVNTNGSARTEDFYWELGVIGGNRLTVTFDVDGCTQEMHERYRQQTNLQKVLNNMKMLSMTRARVVSFTILFEHNEDYEEEIKALCKEYGAHYCTTVESNRFKFFDGKIEGKTYYNRKGEEIRLDPVKSAHNTGGVNEDKNEDHRLVRNHKTGRHTYSDETHYVECLWDKNNEMVVDHDGVIWPCCFTESRLKTGTGDLIAADSIITEIKINPERYSLKHNTLEEVVNSNLYTNDLFQSIKSCGTASGMCLLFCSHAKQVD